MSIQVKQDKENPVPAQILAQSIRNIGDAVRRLDSAGLNDYAITLLLSNASGESKTAVKNVLWGLRNLEALYLKRKVNTK